MSREDPCLDQRKVVHLQQFQGRERNGRAGLPVHITLEGLVRTVVRVLWASVAASAAAAPGSSQSDKEQDREHPGKGHLVPAHCACLCVYVCVGFECGEHGKRSGTWQQGEMGGRRGWTKLHWGNNGARVALHERQYTAN